MFFRSRKRRAGSSADEIDNLIGRQTELMGQIQFTGGLRIDGKVHGDVTALGYGVIVVSELGEVDGDVTASQVICNGLVRGDVRSAGRVELQEKAVIMGNVYYKAIEMALGSTINGTLMCDPSQGALLIGAAIHGEVDQTVDSAALRLGS